jgi:hypothetical protein
VDKVPHIKNFLHVSSAVVKSFNARKSSAELNPKVTVDVRQHYQFTWLAMKSDSQRKYRPVATRKEDNFFIILERVVLLMDSKIYEAFKVAAGKVITRLLGSDVQGSIAQTTQTKD